MYQRLDGLRFGPLSDKTVQLCVDMQRLFVDGTPWETPWAERILPQVVELTAHHPERSIFTRFIPASAPGEGFGVWRRYWLRWSELTLSKLHADFVELAPELSRFTPPAFVIDKKTYSPWTSPALQMLLRARNVDTLLVTGGETDVCVLATALGAIDRGYRVIMVADALCSSSDETHDALLNLFRSRFDQQVETASIEEVLDAWR